MFIAPHFEREGVAEVFRLKSPLAAQLELTDACNNACLHCYNYWRYLETGKRISHDPHARTLDHFRQLLNHLIINEVRTVTFTGGEPFMRRDVLFDLVGDAKRAGLKTGINTNGALITTGDIGRLQDNGVDFLLVSLLSDDPVIHNRITKSYSHASTSRAITNLAKAGLRVAANMVVSVHNWNRVRQTSMYVRNLGLEEFSATPILSCPLASGHSGLLLSSEQVKIVLNDLLWAQARGMKVDVLEPLAHCMFNEDERVRFSRFLSHRSCSAGISDMVVSPDGDVRPCILATSTHGNLFVDGWEKCWSSLACWCSQDLLPHDCLSCAAVDECGGGCRVAAQAVSGNINGSDPYMTKPLTDGGVIATSEDELPVIDQETVIVFPPAVSVRDEGFGCVVFCGPSFMFLDQDGAELLRILKALGTFTPSAVTGRVDIDEKDLNNFLTILAKRGFLTLQTERR